MNIDPKLCNLYTNLETLVSPKRPTETQNEIIRRLIADGWVMRKGKGDHVNFTKSGIRFVVTVDTGVRALF